MDKLWSWQSEQRIVNAATDDIHLFPDYEANLRICSLIDSAIDGGEAILKAIRRRLKNSNHDIQYLTASLLEMCVKNCVPRIFHRTLASGHHMKDLADFAIRCTYWKSKDKLLSVLQYLAQRYPKERPESSMFVFERTFIELIGAGMDFPPLEEDRAPSKDEWKSPGGLSRSYVNKLKADLIDVVQEIASARAAIAVMMREARPSSSYSNARDLLEIASMPRLQSIQSRFSVLLIELVDEEVVEIILLLNEYLQGTISWYQVVRSDHEAFSPDSMDTDAMIRKINELLPVQESESQEDSGRKVYTKEDADEDLQFFAMESRETLAKKEKRSQRAQGGQSNQQQNQQPVEVIQEKNEIDRFFEELAFAK